MFNFRQFAFRVFDGFVEFHSQARAVGCDSSYDASIAVIDVFIIIITGLDDFIADPKSATPVFNFYGQRLACFLAKVSLRGRRVVWI